MEKMTGKRLFGLLLACVAVFSACTIPSTSASDSSIDSSILESIEENSTGGEDGKRTLVKTEIDAIGHTVAYYSDGSYEDWGRATPLNFTPKAPQTKYAYAKLLQTEAGGAMGQLYRRLYDCSLALFESKRTIEQNADGDYLIDEAEYASLGLTRNQAVSVWKNFRLDYPEFFFLNTQIKHTPTKLYLLTDEEYANGETRAQTWTAIKADVYALDGYLSGLTTETERALTIYDYLAYTLEYSYQEDGKTPEEALWAHTLAGVAKDGGVCETYAKAFDYYCGLFGLEALTVTGYAGLTQNSRLGHSWNLVYLSGEWRAVDLTWGDKDSTLQREWFGTGKTEFNATHTAQTPVPDWGIEYLVEMPSISKQTLCPVKWCEDGGETQMADTIEDAFAKMQNEGGRYEVILYPDTTLTKKYAVEISAEKAVFSTAFPKVATLKLRGRYENNGDTAKLTATEGIVLPCDLQIEALTLIAPSFENGEYELVKLDEKSEIKIV